MAKNTSWSIGRLILQIALGVMLAVAGIWAIANTHGGDAGAKALRDLIADRTVESVIVVLYGVIELLAGVFLILELFIGDKFGSFGNVIHILIMIVWIVAIVLIDILNSSTGLNLIGKDFLSWLYQIANHLIVLGAIIYLKD